ncbi:glycosyl transferase [Edwardsiella tarda]|uniref:Glycosyl transferase n=1 Tax=Edwardsiella tarda TaxID=636 RepID=A0A2A7U4B4_EDWTA|nr:glycosyltransferase family 2 protein [Edwardsiella tarda]PEH73195.1 glycosyl transferase [Edwardsiella tarda]BEH72967.1 glycosyltransferase family 2 protein [Edwardsiella tarda]
MKISIITVTYNSEKTLVDTLMSIESQSYKDIEYIIVDGLSSDQTIKLIDRVSTRVSKCISEKDNGIYDALNKGIHLATGDVVGFVHSDDILADADVIENIAAEFERSKADVVYGDLIFIDRDNVNHIRRVWKSGPFKKELLELGWVPPHPSFYLRRKLYIDNGLFDTSFRIAADYDQMIRILKRNDVTVSYLPKVLVKMRIGGESTKLSNAIVSTKEIITIMKKNNINWYFAIVYRKMSKIMQMFFKN